MPRGKKAEEPSQELSKADRLKLAAQKINKKFGRQILLAGDQVESKGKLPSNVVAIDEKVGGGLQRGNFSIVYGAPGCGKTTLCIMEAIAAMQRGESVVYIYLEHKFDIDRAKQLGLDQDSPLWMLEADTDTAEEAMEVIRILAKEQAADLVIVDSVQGMAPQKSKYNTQHGKITSDRDLARQEIGALAVVLSKFFPVCSNEVSQSKMGVLLIGQLRTKGIGSFMTYGGLSGGNALEHWSVLTVAMRRGKKSDAPREGGKKTGDIVGFNCVLKIEKGHVFGCAPEGTEWSLPYHFASGFPLDAVAGSDTGVEEEEDEEDNLK